MCIPLLLRLPFLTSGCAISSFHIFFTFKFNEPVMPTGTCCLALMLCSVFIFVMHVRVLVASVDRVWSILIQRRGWAYSFCNILVSICIYIRLVFCLSRQSTFCDPLLGLILVLLVALYIDFQVLGRIFLCIYVLVCFHLFLFLS